MKNDLIYEVDYLKVSTKGKIILYLLLLTWKLISRWIQKF